jgi:hypothetical protein
MFLRQTAIRANMMYARNTHSSIAVALMTASRSMTAASASSNRPCS